MKVRAAPLVARIRDIRTLAWRIASRIQRSGRLPRLGLPLLSVLLITLGLALPWLAVPLQAQRSAWSIRVVLAGTSSFSLVSYGIVLAACVTLGGAALVRGRGRPSAATAAVGAGALVVSLTFLVATRTADWPLLQQLEDQTAQQTAIFGQFGYAVPGQQASMMLVVPVTGSWQLVWGALRLGWFSTAVGGVVLFGTGASSLARWFRRARWRAKLLPAVVMLLLADVVGRGAFADYLAQRGAAAAAAGDYRAANSSLGAAARLNSLLTSSAAYELAVGQALLAGGSTGKPLALLADATARGASGNIRGQVSELLTAGKRDPANPVLLGQLDQASQLLGLTQQDPVALQELRDPTAADEYTLGRVLYAAADYTDALASLRRVLSMTGDANVISSAFTYIALSEMKLGQADPARRDLLRAVSVDTGYNNTLARSLVAGLFVSTKSGSA